MVLALLSSVLQLSLSLATSDVGALLVNWGLSRRDAALLEHRHQRLHGSPISLDEAAATLRAVDELGLAPGRAVHLLKVTSFEELRAQCSTQKRWCTYKKHLCDCGVGPVQVAPQPPPRLLSLDCEFRPLRCAAVDENGDTALDVLIPDRHSFPMLPGVLASDRQLLNFSTVPEVQDWVLERLRSGVTLVGHTLSSDLAALRLSHEALSHFNGRVVDIANVDGDGRTISLRRMAQAELGVEMHRQGERHCALQDAIIAMRLYHHQHGTAW